MMLGYLIAVILLTGGLGASSFLFIRNLVQSGRLTSYDGKGYYMVMMFFVTFVAGSAAFYWGQPLDLGDDPEQLGQAAVGLLMAVAVSITLLGGGLLNIREKQEIV